MVRGIALFLVLTLLGMILISLVVAATYRLAPEGQRRPNARWLVLWLLKGFGLPFALWILMNLGVSWHFQPFMPEVQAAKNSGGDWVPELFRVIGLGMFVLSSYWTALTFGWVLARTVRRLDSEARAKLKALGWLCVAAAALPVALLLFLGGWPTLGLAAAIVLGAVVMSAPAVLKVEKLPPMYARAVARIKFGKYADAEWEIIRELEKCEDDFDGWLMLADLYANHFKDLSEAEQTILEICDQPRTTPSQLSIALHRLSDWQLKLAGDPDAARRSLRMICDRLRGSHLARMAELRINQLPATAEEWREQQTARPIPLPALGDHFDESANAAAARRPCSATLSLAHAWVERLKLEPNDSGTREKLARLYAEQMDQPELALEQVQLLLAMPDQPETQRAEWLSLAAAWQLKYRHDLDSGRRLLEQIIQEFPLRPQALAARRRLELLDHEKKSA
jgi:hypothetical protein